MNLGFMQNWPKEMGMTDNKTNFVEKIWAGLINENIPPTIGEYSDYNDLHKERFGKDMSDYDQVSIKPKLHTIRWDENNRWKPGMNIHFVINGRSKNRFQFAPVIPCVSTQNIEIEYLDSSRAQNPNYKYCCIRIDGRGISPEELEILALNDGFESVADFFKYFNKDFKGKLIHWTNLKY